MKRILGMDLGGENIRICQSRGVILEEDAAAAVQSSDQSVIAVCSQAVSLSRRTPGNADLIYPLRGNLSAHYMAIRAILRYCMDQADFRTGELILSVRHGLTKQEENVLIGAAQDAGAKTVHLIYKSVVAAMGSGANIMSPQYRMVIDMGATAAEMCAIGDGRAYVCSQPLAGGHSLSRLIGKYLRDHEQVSLGERALFDIKRNACNIWEPNGVRIAETVRALRMADGMPCSLDITTQQTADAIEKGIDALCQGAADFIASLPQGVQEDIRIRGILLTGSGSLLGGLDSYLTSKLGVDVRVAQNASGCGASGLADFIMNIDAYEEDGLYYFAENHVQSE